jgi:glycosyltransferase involved in cell wall biosynthesis
MATPGPNSGEGDTLPGTRPVDGGGRPTVGLAMIVRNEAATLPRLAVTLQGHIDHWTLVDTGSTDDTLQVARQAFSYAPGEIFEDAWRGFGPSRNIAFEAAEPHSDWLLTLDADDTFHGTVVASELTGVDSLEAEYRYASLRYWVPRLVRSGRGWRWHGRAHEYLAAPEVSKTARSGSFWVEHHADGGSRADKFQREVTLLLEDWAERPDDPRTAFYLGRSYDDLGNNAQAIVWYRRRLSVGGWEEENFYTRFRLGACLLRTGQAEEGCGELWRAWGERPWRAEPLVLLAEHYRGQSLWELAWQASELAFGRAGAEPDGRDGGRVDSLFVDASVLQWRVAYEASITAWYVGQFHRGRRLVSYLLSRDDLPEDIRHAVEGNQRFYAAGEQAGPSGHW